MKNILLKVNDEIHEKLTKMSKDEGRSLTKQTELILKNYIDMATNKAVPTETDNRNFL